MWRAIVLPLLAAALSAGLPGPAVADCMCAANGTRYELGAVVCVRSPAGTWLGRCGKVLNNTSWTKLADGCPVTLHAEGAGEPTSRPQPVTATPRPQSPDHG